MSIVRVNSLAVSLDGYAAGPHQSLDAPLGVCGPALFDWFFSTHVEADARVRWGLDWC
jgi:hypothetical protein